MIATIRMENPVGMALTDTHLLVCDNAVHVFRRVGRELINVFQTEKIFAKDIILNDSLAVIVSDKIVYQYKFKNEKIVFLSKI